MAHAESDLNLAYLGRKHNNIMPVQICFHAQQAAEKALKAVLLSRKIDFPLTHDIHELLEIGERGGIKLPSKLYNASILTPYAVETRYPGYWEHVTSTDLDEALKQAGEVIDWAKKFLAGRERGRP
jgi:HEPN domain-containing protein